MYVLYQNKLYLLVVVENFMALVIYNPCFCEIITGVLLSAGVLSQLPNLLFPFTAFKYNKYTVF